MRTLSKRREWPITIKVPLLVAALMLAISFVISNTVRSRLAQTQERNLQALSRTYVEGLSTNLLPHMLREDVWEVFDALDRASKSGSRRFASAAPRSLANAREAAERQQITLALSENDGQIGKTAEALGVSRTTLWEKMKRYGLADS